ncbi:hypothetical protein HID58_035012 [Brassica napus]|uniref:Uncharacterized protein n=1 Tax=Brassica napus TaxID=3708 RepID=A0ABQ8C5N2_BRANA|nr:hypothetical protein HID58_035012 [Brassica napus]
MRADAARIVRKRPRNESATKAPRRGSNDAPPWIDLVVPSDTLSDSTRSRSRRTAQLPPHLPSGKSKFRRSTNEFGGNLGEFTDDESGGSPASGGRSDGGFVSVVNGSVNCFGKKRSSGFVISAGDRHFRQISISLPFYPSISRSYIPPKLANMGSQGNLCEDVHPSGSLEPLMITSFDDKPFGFIFVTYNSLSSMPNKNVTVPLSSGIYGQQLQPSSLGTEQNLNNDNICTQSCRAIVSYLHPIFKKENLYHMQQQEGNFDVPPNSQGSDKQQQRNNNIMVFTISILHLGHVLNNVYLTCTLARALIHNTQASVSLKLFKPSSSFNSLFLNNLTPRRPFFNSSIHQRRRPQRQSNQCLERGESSSVSQRQLQPSFLGTEENLNNYHLPTQNCHAIQQQHQQGRNFHVQPNNQGLYNQMMMDSAPRRSEALTGVNQQLNERTTSLEEPNIPTMQQYQQQFSRRYDPNSTFGYHVPFASSSGMHSQQPLAPSSLYSGTQGLIDQRSSSFKSPRLKNQTHIRPFTNSSILLQKNFLHNYDTIESGGHINGQSSTHHLATDTLVSSNHIHRRRRPQSNECEFGESSSSAKRMRIISPGENNESFADSLLNLREERTTNSVLSPTYRTSGLTVNPHLRRSDDIRSPYGPYDERYEADRQYLDPHMRKFENSVRRGN